MRPAYTLRLSIAPPHTLQFQPVTELRTPDVVREAA